MNRTRPRAFHRLTPCWSGANRIWRCENCGATWTVLPPVDQRKGCVVTDIEARHT